MVFNTSGVKRLVLQNFRNYHSLELAVDTRSVALTGPNGAGKTNILESLSFLSPGKGLRNVGLSDVTYTASTVDDNQTKSSSWSVFTELSHAGDTIQIGTALEPHQGRDRRVVKVNGEFLKKQSDLSSQCRVIWVTPLMDRLFIEGASSRRKFLDRLVYGHDPLHADYVARYEKAIKERNRILEESGDALWLDRVEEEVANASVRITKARQIFLERLMTMQSTLTPIFPFAEALLSSSVGDKTQSDEEKMSTLQSLLKQFRGRDKLTGRCSVGAHKEDLCVIFQSKNRAADQCSTGEQKALLLSLILASVKLIATEQDGVPLLLLDEVIAHLDEDRRAQLFEVLFEMNIQIWMTGTDAEIFAKWREKIQHLFVKNAIVQQL